MSSAQDRLKQILDVAPKGWHGTTYPNDSRFVGREAFMDAMLELLHGSEAITTEQLSSLYPEDYVRLGSPFSTLLEVVTALDRGFEPKHTFVFGSSNLPLISLLLATNNPVFVYTTTTPLLNSDQEERLRKYYGRTFTTLEGEPQDHGSDAIVVLISDDHNKDISPAVDAIVGSDGFLFVRNTDKIAPVDVVTDAGRREGIHTMRKRLGAPPPTPQALARLRGQPCPEVPDVSAFKQHLKELAGVGSAGGDVLVSTVGLSALGAAVMASLEVGEGRIDSLMCSTAYGGSSQQTDILSTRSQTASVQMQRHKFNIQGAAADVFQRMKLALSEMEKGERKPLTLVQLEYPTNPDMKDCDVVSLASELESYGEKTGSQVLLLLDTTFSPPSQVAGTIPNIPVIVFNSMSKSLSGGYTTGGSLVANDTPLAQRVLKVAHDHLSLMDTAAKPSQLKIFNEMHEEAEERVRKAYNNCVQAAAAFEQAVQKHSGVAMKTNFVTDAQITKRVTPATFSFNLPPPAGASHAELEALAQSFVDSLANSAFGQQGGIKPCVSFGQNNSTIYVTVPATSTQGVISKELTAKQALGGVQLVRLSFPTNMDHSAWEAAVDTALGKVYAHQTAAPSASSSSSASSKNDASTKSEAATKASTPSASAGGSFSLGPLLVAAVSAVVAGALYHRYRSSNSGKR